MKLPWRIVPIQMMKANTPWSPIYSVADSAEHQLYSMGVADKNITPDIVSLYRNLLNISHYEGMSEE